MDFFQVLLCFQHLSLILFNINKFKNLFNTPPSSSSWNRAGMGRYNIIQLLFTFQPAIHLNQIFFYQHKIYTTGLIQTENACEPYTPN